MLKNSTKYILVTGGVISGIGKGIFASSVGALLKACGKRVTAIKIDPYINIDAGTFSPYEHGEVFVLDDGGEVDLDLGNYERFLNIKLTRNNNITTGKIYQSVINKERKGEYLGKTVQVVPHITNEIQDLIHEVSLISVEENNLPPEICIIELGGTVGDIEGMPFFEAFRQFQFKVGKEDFCTFHLSLVLQPNLSKEHKTKPTQKSVREIRSLGISPDFIICRSEERISDLVKEKISNFCNVRKDYVINIPDLKSLYNLPLELLNQNLILLLAKKFNLSNLIVSKEYIENWKNLNNQNSFEKNVKIALVGKYTRLEDSYTSVIKSLNHASFACHLNLSIVYIEACYLEENMKKTNFLKYEKAWNDLKNVDGILIPGGFGIRGTRGKINAIQYARENKIPFLGICLGLQLAAVEFAKNVLNLTNADSCEINPNTTEPIIIDMPEHNQGYLGGTMRLGRRLTKFNSDNSILKKLYDNKDFIEERHRHRYEINIKYLKKFNENGLRFVGHDETGERMEIFELENHPYFVGVQFHPEYLSNFNKPSPPFLGLILAASKNLENYLNNNKFFATN